MWLGSRRARSPGLWPCCGPGVGAFWSRLGVRSRPASGRPRSGPFWSSTDQDEDRRVAGGPVPLSGAWVALASARSMCASAVPVPSTRTGRQDTMVVTGHGARAIPAWAIRWQAACPAMPSAKEQISRPLGEPAGPVADRASSSQAQARRRRTRPGADWQGDGGVQVQRGPDAWQRGDQPEPGLLRDADPPGPHLGRRRGSQDQQRPGPDGPARPDRRGGPVRSGWCAGPDRDRATQVRVRSGGGVDR